MLLFLIVGYYWHCRQIFIVPDFIIDKAPSAGLFDGQTDESEMGVAYRSIDEFLSAGSVNERDGAIIERFHKSSGHKRKMPVVFGV